MTATTIEEALRGHRFGRRVHRFTAIDSTNDRALADLEGGLARDGDVYIADLQTRGRGTGDRRWESAPGQGLWLSLVIRGGLAARPLPFLPALAIADFLAGLGLPAHLKWPNDVMVGARKIAGILVEGRSTSGGEAAFVVGLGLNLSQTNFPSEIADRATSLHLEGGIPVEPAQAAIEILRRMSLMEAGAIDLVPAFRARCRMIGRHIHDLDGRSFLVRDLSPEGFLLVTDEAGQERRIISRSDAEIRPDWLAGAPPFTPPPPVV